MIQEWIDYIRSDAPDWARSRGLVYESIALRSRLHRQKDQWQPHLENSRQEILRFLDQFPTGKKIFILGSGHLMELPLSIFDRPDNDFILVDAVHPREIQKWAKKYSNVQLLTVDLSQPAYEVFGELGGQISEDDLVISCNLLSQLPLSHLRGRDTERDNKIAVAVLRSHLEFLRKLKVPTMLLSDFERCYRSDRSDIIETESSLWGLRLLAPRTRWTWKLAPLGERSKDFAVELEVGTWEFNLPSLMIPKGEV